MRGYESGGVMPPLDKALILAEYYGIELEELAETVLGRPYKASATNGAPAGAPDASEPVADSGKAIALKAAGRGSREPQKRRPK